MAKQLKKFKSVGINPLKAQINYIVSIHCYLWDDKVNGNSYSGARVYINQTLVYAVPVTYGNDYNLYCDIMSRLNLPRYESAQLELGVIVNVARSYIKYKQIKTVTAFSLFVE